MRNVKNVLGYLGCICIAAAVGYYIDGTVGIILTIALSIAFVLSLAVTLVVKGFISVEISTDKTLLVKGEHITLSVMLSKKIPIPAPIIEIEADCSKQLAPDNGTFFAVSLAGTERNVVKIPFTANYSGAATVRISSLMISDYLGIFRFKMKMNQSLEEKISIYPDIPDVVVQTDFLKTASQFSDNDDDEEETDETAIGATGMPGYNHRQYEPGDPIKRINWKLSSKRDIYMVRLDEKVCGAGQMFFLDCTKTEETENALKIKDNVIEATLAMFTMLIREGREATFFYYKDNMWLKAEIHNMGDVYALQEEFSDFEPSEPASVIPPEIISSMKTPICFSTASAEYPQSAVDAVSAYPDLLMLSSEMAGLQNICPNLWTVSEDFEFKKQSK
ncbi:MAG: DUF58 domain-containing protein [Ruminococcus sp.]|nr:DUF58 domain-containing protein [Ruminococcus sp.]